jgi:hypothetical protein
MPQNPPDRKWLRPVLDGFFSQPDVCRPLGELVCRLSGQATFWAMGGALRNLFIQTLHKNSLPTHDIDLVIEGVEKDRDLTGLFSTKECRPLELGGVRWFPKESRFAFDLCRIEDFIMIHHFQLDPTPQSLLDTIDLDVNAVIYDFQRKQLHEKNCLSAIAAHIIGRNSSLILDKVLLAYRCLLIRHKTGFILSEELYRFLKCNLTLDDLIKLRAMAVSKQDPAVAKALMNDYRKLCRQTNYSHYCKGGC